VTKSRPCEQQPQVVKWKGFGICNRPSAPSWHSFVWPASRLPAERIRHFLGNFINVRKLGMPYATKRANPQAFWHLVLVARSGAVVVAAVIVTTGPEASATSAPTSVPAASTASCTNSFPLSLLVEDHHADRPQLVADPVLRCFRG
jgi:hypothetical protein